MLLIVNPAAAGGRVRRRWPRWAAALRASGAEVRTEVTSRPGEAADLARSAVRRGVRDIGAAGGDGTVNEVVNGLVEDDALIHPDVRLTMLPLGSGCDFARTLGLPRDPRGAVQLLASDRYRPLDVGRAVYADREGRERVRYFVNIVEAGVGGEVMRRVNRSPKRFGARLAFLRAILGTLWSYENPPVRVRVDGETIAEERLNSVVAANGRYYGHGLRPAPWAEVDDGLLDVVLFGDVGFREAVGSMRRLRKGTHLDHPKVSHTRGRELVATSAVEVPVEMDGEAVGRLPLHVTLLPRLLPVRVLA